MEQAFKRVAYVAGKMSLAWVRQKLYASQLDEWIRMLEEALSTLKQIRAATQSSRDPGRPAVRSAHSEQG